ncbi:MAG TPA: DUF6299 family protein [Candidatus Limnocylindrales bacterium]|jgi:hypothetical protein|nr:DUF6299 family protein [Candidatus Limnocylindrales bacterium]
MKRFGILTSLVMASSLAFAAPVLAAAPANDTYAGRTLIGSIPFSESIDTTEATTDADDVEANAPCGAPATEASVWYEVTAAADGGLVVDVSASGYPAGVIVVTGTPGGFSLVTCGPFAVAFETTAGQTYSILAFDFEPGGTNGGTLSITVQEIPPPPVVDVTVDPYGTFNSITGSATITGTVTCTGTADFAFIDVQLRQTVGRFTVSGFGFIEFTCDGTTQPWSVEVSPDNGLFKGGRSVAVTFALACGPFACGEDFEEHIVRLRR